ncbi:hypothetical protein [Acidocella sp.]|uniref:hypothetical protein n=1 Tax=Acidocella sp. TaxID=50710 RepID=UPI001830143E|nr:hypothetical protein [Acidocella sp.]NNM57569.1 hypothetical protein [Acidocella sp.]
MHSTRTAWGLGKTGVAIGLAMLALASCSKKTPVAVLAPPPAPVGHVYPTAVQIPAVTSRRVKFTPAQRDAYQQAFNIIGLKSALMIGALSCDQRGQYDTFMTTFHPHILAAQHVMDGYFRRMGGWAGQSREDDFVTLLANNQSISAQAQGSLFCLNNSAEFKAVLALRSPRDLDAFVSDQAPQRPATVASTASASAP